MLRHGLMTFTTLLLLLAVAAVHAANIPVSQAAPKSKLDVTMDVVPLNSDIEKTVVQTIHLPTAMRTSKPSAKAAKTPAATKPAASHISGKPVDKARQTILRQTIEARREAEQAVKEARKDRDNSGVPDNDTPPPP